MDTEAKVQRMYAALEYLRRALQKPRLEVQQVQMLLKLHQYPDGIAMQDLAKAIDTDPSFVTRNVKTFGPAGGVAVIDQRIDYANPRCRLISLNAHGMKLMAAFTDVTAGLRKVPKVAPILDARAAKQ